MSLRVGGKSFKDGAETSLRVDEYGQLAVASSAGPGLPTQYFLTEAGNGTGAYNLSINYSAAATDVYYQTTTQYDINTVAVIVADAANFNMLDYGAIAGGLTNGVKFFVKQAGLPEIQLLSGHTIHSNIDWLTLTSNVSLTTFAGQAQAMTIIFDLIGEYGKSLTLNAGDRFIARLNDDFSGLVSHTIGLRGIKY